MVQRKEKPLLIGIIVDVSSSMQTNWKNRDGKALPKIEVIRDILNRQAWKYSVLFSSKPNKRTSPNIFCLGMGFQRPIFWSGIKTSYGREVILTNTSKMSIERDVVCDLLALCELVPTEDQLYRIETEINKKWQSFANQLLNKARIDDNVFFQLQDYIESEINLSAHHRLRSGILYKVYLKLYNDNNVDQSQWKQYVFDKLSRYIERWEEKIQGESPKISKDFFDGILAKSKGIFDKNKETYVAFIKATLDDFVANYTQMLLTLLTLGYTPHKIINYFDEDTVMSLAQQIYLELDKEIKDSIKVAWAVNYYHLYFRRKRLRASLDSSRLRNLTEKCVQKYSWDILEPFVQQTVRDIFKSQFTKQAEQKMSDWIGLASHREVVRPFHQVVQLFPSSLAASFYSNKFMFGSTPVGESIERASLRFLDKTWINREKILVIISDGEFESNYPIDVSLLLKQSGVTIICCYLASQDIMSKLRSTTSNKWPDGAKILFEMASTIEDNQQLHRSIIEKGFQAPEGVKLFYQINHSEFLEHIFDTILGEM